VTGARLDRGRRGLPHWVLAPVVTSVAAAACVPGFPVGALAILLAAVLVRAFLTFVGRELTAPRAWGTLWVSGPAAATAYVAWASQDGSVPVPPLLGVGVVGLAIGTIAPASLFLALRLLALSTALCAAAALLSPTAAVTLASVAFAATLVPAALALDARYGGVPSHGGDGGVRRIVAGRAGPLRPGRTAFAALGMLALGLPLGLWLFATLPARPKPMDAKSGAGPGAAMRRSMGPLEGDGLADPTGSAETGGRQGRRSPYRASLRQNQRVVFTVRLEDGSQGPAPLWLRGQTFDLFTGTSWERSRAAESSTTVVLEGGWFPLRHAPSRGTRVRIRVTDHVGANGGALPLLAVADRVRWSGSETNALLECRDGTTTAVGPVAPETSYDEEAVVPSPDRSGLPTRRGADRLPPLESYVRPFPETETYRRLALVAVKGATDAAARAERLEAWLRGPDFAYALTDLTMDASRPVADFLGKARRGHCWCFASAMVGMMRSLGHPARLATGWRGGDWLKTLGEWSFRGTHAHAWCEVWLGDVGWVTYDPTPASAADSTTAESEDDVSVLDRVARFSPADRRLLFAALRAGLQRAMRAIADAASSLPVVASVAVLLLAAGAWRLRRRARPRLAGSAGHATALPRGPYAKALALLAAHEVRRRPHETPAELEARAVHLRPAVADPLAALTASHVLTRYGETPLAADDLRRLERAADDLGDRLRRPPPS